MLQLQSSTLWSRFNHAVSKVLAAKAGPQAQRIKDPLCPLA
jgi:hypothetical protein